MLPLSTRRISTQRQRWGLFSIGLLFSIAALLLLSSGSSAYAGEENPTGAAPCASCHSDETDAWLTSAHAVEMGDTTGTTGAACAACHGEYSKGHPEDGAMELLTVDSAICQDCHETTYDQWEHSIHASRNVQCIGCHQVHSQDLRLTDDQLCSACHTESLTDSFHSAHWYVDAACTDCHMSPTTIPGELVMVGNQASITAPVHDFTTVSSAKCLDCHRESVTNPAERLDVQQLALTQLHDEQQRANELDARLASARQTTKSLQVLTPLNLGFGIGIGGILGIIFMLFVARYGRTGGDS